VAGVPDDDRQATPAATASHQAALQEVGLTRYESSAYLALLGRESATPTEVARLAGVPRPRIYDVLGALARRRLVRVMSDRPLRYRAEPPETAVGRLVKHREQETAVAAAAALAAVHPLTELFQAGQGQAEPLDYVEVLRDSAEAARRIGELWASAREEVLVLVRPPYLAPPTLDDVTVPTGIRQRAIYDSTLLEDPQMARVLARYAELGEEVRIASDLPLKLTVVDGRSVAFNMPDPVAADRSVTTVVIHHQMLAATLTIAFESLWTNATPLPDVAVGEEGGGVLLGEES
jgi:sugar-specific transcriptional regulator TrmB